MIDVKPLVKKALEAIEGVKVFFYFPNNFNALPCISYYEAGNTPDTASDDIEYLSEIIYVIDVWGKSSEIVSGIAIQVDGVMKKAGFIREFAADVNNQQSAVRHKTMRYKIIL